MQETWVWPVAGKIPWRRKWQLTAAFLPGKSHGWRNLAGYSPGGRKESGMTETVTTQNVKHCFRTLESDLRRNKWRVLDPWKQGNCSGWNARECEPSEGSSWSAQGGAARTYRSEKLEDGVWWPEWLEKEGWNFSCRGFLLWMSVGFCKCFFCIYWYNRVVFLS